MTHHSFRITADSGELAWEGPDGVVTLRHVVGARESYEPARRETVKAINEGRLTGRLRNELRGLEDSVLVLNRALREAVLAWLGEGGTLSELAQRCGKDQKATSWLQRRVGLKPDSRGSGLTVWVHTDVLAVIARGLDVPPNEVELGWDPEIVSNPPRSGPHARLSHRVSLGV